MVEMNPSTKRPWTVTIISWLLIIYALFSAIPKIFLIINPEAYEMALELNQAASNVGFIHVPYSLQLAHALVGVLVLSVSGIFMLKGRLWALIVLFVWMIGVLVLTCLVLGLSISLYAKLIVAIIVTILLTRPKTLSYFSSHDDQSQS